MPLYFLRRTLTLFLCISLCVPPLSVHAELSLRQKEGRIRQCSTLRDVTAAESASKQSGLEEALGSEEEGITPQTGEEQVLETIGYRFKVEPSSFESVEFRRKEINEEKRYFNGINIFVNGQRYYWSFSDDRKVYEVIKEEYGDDLVELEDFQLKLLLLDLYKFEAQRGLQNFQFEVILEYTAQNVLVTITENGKKDCYKIQRSFPFTVTGPQGEYIGGGGGRVFTLAEAALKLDDELRPLIGMRSLDIFTFLPSEFRKLRSNTAGLEENDLEEWMQAFTQDQNLITQN